MNRVYKWIAFTSESHLQVTHISKWKMLTSEKCLQVKNTYKWKMLTSKNVYKWKMFINEKCLQVNQFYKWIISTRLLCFIEFRPEHEEVSFFLRVVPTNQWWPIKCWLPQKPLSSLPNEQQHIIIKMSGCLFWEMARTYFGVFFKLLKE